MDIWHETCDVANDGADRTSICDGTCGSAKLTEGMRIFRRHLRSLATVWLVVQAGWVSAIVPRDCCAAHRPATVKTDRSCHDPVAVAHMHHEMGQPREQQQDANKCALRGTCAGPMAALFALLSNHGILTESATPTPNTGTALVAPPAIENVVGRLETPDPPPPRA